MLINNQSQIVAARVADFDISYKPLTNEFQGREQYKFDRVRAECREVLVPVGHSCGDMFHLGTRARLITK